MGVPFGRIAIFAFGDIMQLAPCMGRYIFDEPINPEFKVTYALDSRWHQFQSMDLEENHRQGQDKAYADLLNRIRVGQHTQEDINLLNTRVRPANHPDLRSASLYILCKRRDCDRINIEYLNNINGELFEVKAHHHHATQKNYKPFIDKKDGSVSCIHK